MINIIIVSEKMAKPKTLGMFESVGIALALVLVPVVLTLLFITPQQVIKSQGVKAMLPPHLRGAMLSTQSHLDAYAKQIGELQARILRLDAQNQRLSKLAGVRSTAEPINERTLVNEVPTSAPLGQGGPLVKDSPLSEEDLKATIEQMSADLDFRDAFQGKIEAKLLQKSVLREMLPNSSPVEAAYSSSSYGWRIDPMSGHRAFHEGLDFPASVGMPVFAAADGIVITAVQTPDYGNLLKIDHGSGLETRYAHNSRLLVKPGDRVMKGQKIALIGSTGRSTGPHLHYEIRLNGNPLDPREYLRNHS
ncbi:M23 family metallopeptidase [Methylophilus medardicus]|uniref:M23 family metallopeptidase n=1 Tax=Methylophilus medardicus TaxID=2588534 RepID=A0A5B8CQF6_9PROT|nr:M23 family metallopeptidase [Methylophilus medardicus]QDC43472.1 M23 family metallopeptidase [Methylophilus medardicus]QDC48479.1 M23 family metallopeptidase [Methylophilus medardicus]QDC52184.1 M23 family metallopeptidase [Methylophilus medardicus]